MEIVGLLLRLGEFGYFVEGEIADELLKEIVGLRGVVLQVHKMFFDFAKITGYGSFVYF